jgi:predicted PurR-regulated permease PerM
MGYLRQSGMMPSGDMSQIGSQMVGGMGRLTTALSSAFGALSSILMVLVIGIFIAIEPKLYDRGVAWMLPKAQRSGFYELSEKVGATLRRLMFGRIVGMVVEGVGTWLMLWAGGVPMAALLGLLTGLLAFVPNIGAIVSGVLMVAVGFSAGSDAGLWAIATYLIVQTIDGYVIVPYVARRTVDLAPALVLAAQLLFGVLFGLMGLLLADPIVATIKVSLEEWAKRRAGGDTANEEPEAEAEPAGC